MNRAVGDLDERIERVLSDPTLVGHPAREALFELRGRLASQLTRIERITALSDAYQAMARDREMSLADRFDRQLRRLSKIVNISDRYQEALRDQNQAVVDASNHDPLTEILNRRGLAERLRTCCDNALATQQGFTVAMVDADHFKSVNDRFGHEAGDRALQALAKALSTDLAAPSFCGRWGGEEFLVVLPDQVLDAGERTMMNLLRAVRGLQVPVDDAVLTMTVSAGVAEHRPGEALSLTLNRADVALYDAKQAGRDCVHRERTTF